MLVLTRSLWQNRRLLRDFVRRDLKARYVGSSMGFFWSVIFPIVNLAVYMFVFRLILKMRFSDSASPGDVAIWMLAGITVWAAFAETVSRTTNTLVENTNLIQKVVFPSEVLPAYLCISSLINMLIGLPIVLLGVWWFAYGPGSNFETETAGLALQAAESRPRDQSLGFGAPMLLLPVLMALQALLTVGLGYLLSTLNVFLRDTYHLVGVFITVWMFATPIFYPERMVRWDYKPALDRFEPGQYAWILDVNPMHWLIKSYRDVLIFADWPDPLMLGKFALVALAVFALGTSFFQAQKARFPDLL
jgi:ABC-type polysaccharide/polyol phosphate export permease